MTRDNERSPTIFPEVTGLTSVLTSVVARTNVQTSQAAASTKTVTGTTIVIPAGEFTKGSTFIYTLFGTKDAGNGTVAVKLNLNGTDVLTLTSGSSAAGDWMFRGSVSSLTSASQNCFGFFDQTAVVEVVDFATASVSTVGPSTLKATITNSSASDTVTVEHATVEYVYIAP